MASSAFPIYHDPIQPHPRSRRSSSRKSFASSLTRSTSNIEVSRTACPKDGDAFSYDPSHLSAWYLPRELWDPLPAPLQSALAAVQHSGAAVLTGFERLDKHTEELSRRHSQKLSEEVLLAKLGDLPPPKFRTTSNASSVFYSDASSPVTPASPESYSGYASPVTSSFVLPQAASPFSPVALSANDAPSSSQRERSFSTPLEPHDAYYATELSHLRTEALPRLKHLGYKVDTEWQEAMRTTTISTDNINSFENWWTEKKCNILALNEKCRRLADDVGIASTGIGWTAP